MKIIEDITINRRTRERLDGIRVAWREFVDDVYRGPVVRLFIGLGAAMITAALMMLPWLTDGAYFE